ncbi:MAG: STAS domain-containing protein [Planctomycetes bacterium]|nr:STAS domain-containing protein [Planctomycetota bacterium]MBL7039723.1 STAS domain-containing protein [Pirellulaceae bacterium]
MTALQYFSVERHGDVIELRLENPAHFDVPRYEELRNELARFAEEEQPAKLLVDFSNVEYCSTAVIAALVQIRKRLGAEGGQIKFCGLNESVHEAFKMLKLDGTLFDIHATEAAAMKAF